MEDNKKKFHVGAGIGYFFFSWMPLLMFLAIQIVAAVLVLVVLMAQVLVGYVANLQELADIAVVFDQIMDVYQDNIMWISIIYQILALVAFGLWYYLVWGQRRRSNVKMLTAKSVGKIIALGICFELMISSVLAIVEIFFPDIMAEYERLMEEAGMNEISLVVALAAIIMAPIVEELAFRGVTLRLALHITGKNSLSDNVTFWIANILQALAFGIGHLNLVQSSYAFVLGIVMGCIIRKYKTLYASMILHAVFNFAGTVFAALIALIPYTDTLIANILMILIFGIASFGVYQTIKRDEPISI